MAMRSANIYELLDEDAQENAPVKKKEKGKTADKKNLQRKQQRNLHQSQNLLLLLNLLRTEVKIHLREDVAADLEGETMMDREEEGEAVAAAVGVVGMIGVVDEEGDSVMKKEEVEVVEVVEVVEKGGSVVEEGGSVVMRNQEEVVGEDVEAAVEAEVGVVLMRTDLIVIAVQVVMNVKKEVGEVHGTGAPIRIMYKNRPKRPRPTRKLLLQEKHLLVNKLGAILLRKKHLRMARQKLIMNRRLDRTQNIWKIWRLNVLPSQKTRRLGLHWLVANSKKPRF